MTDRLVTWRPELIGLVSLAVLSLCRVRLMRVALELEDPGEGMVGRRIGEGLGRVEDGIRYTVALDLEAFKRNLKSQLAYRQV